MFKPRPTFVVVNLVVVFALLGMEWYETHGGPVILPPKDFFLVITLVWPLTIVLCGLFGRRPRREQV